MWRVIIQRKDKHPIAFKTMDLKHILQTVFLCAVQEENEQGTESRMTMSVSIRKSTGAEISFTDYRVVGDQYGPWGASTINGLERTGKIQPVRINEEFVDVVLPRQIRIAARRTS